MDKLTERLAQGDQEAFAELYDSCAGRCHHYLSVHLGSRDAADEVLQETFLRLVRSRGKLVGVDNLVAYVFPIARSEAGRHAGRKAQQARHRAPLAAEDLFLEARSDQAAAREMAVLLVAGLRHLDSQRRV